MPLQTLNMDCISVQTIYDYAESRARRYPQYRPALAHVYDAYQDARKHNLRFNRKTHVLRDNRLGVLSQPADYTPEECSVDEAREYMARKIWCAAVRRHNLATA